MATYERTLTHDGVDKSLVSEQRECMTHGPSAHGHVFAQIVLFPKGRIGWQFLDVSEKLAIDFGVSPLRLVPFWLIEDFQCRAVT
jgi:hypothetical protein